VLDQALGRILQRHLFRGHYIRGGFVQTALLGRILDGVGAKAAEGAAEMGEVTF
jgi:hypothetical protein